VAVRSGLVDQFGNVPDADGDERPAKPLGASPPNTFMEDRLPARTRVEGESTPASLADHARLRCMMLIRKHAPRCARASGPRTMGAGPQ